MSARVRAGAPNSGRGGDGPRRRWSESPIPRVATRRVGVSGVVAAPPPIWDWYIWGDSFAGTLDATGLYLVNAGNVSVVSGVGSQVGASIDWAVTMPSSIPDSGNVVFKCLDTSVFTTIETITFTGPITPSSIMAATFTLPADTAMYLVDSDQTRLNAWRAAWGLVADPDDYYATSSLA